MVAKYVRDLPEPVPEVTINSLPFAPSSIASSWCLYKLKPEKILSISV